MTAAAKLRARKVSKALLNSAVTVSEVAALALLVNVIMFVFNLFPLPPLDGGRILTSLLPPRLAIPFSRIEPWGFFIVMGLIVAGVISKLWMLPLMSLTFSLLDLLLSPLAALLS